MLIYGQLGKKERGGGGDTPMPTMVAKFASVHEHVLVLKEALASSRFNILLSKVT